MARPKKDDPRDRQLNLSLTAAELALVKARADATGMRIAEYGRARILTTGTMLPQTARRHSRIERAFVDEVRRIGVNLNQISRRLNSLPAPLAPPSLEPLLRDLRRILAKEMQSP